jgi:hypothetical protein
MFIKAHTYEVHIVTYIALNIIKIECFSVSLEIQERGCFSIMQYAEQALTQ